MLSRPEADIESRPASRARPEHKHNPARAEIILPCPSMESTLAARRKPELQTRGWSAPRSARCCKNAAARAGRGGCGHMPGAPRGLTGIRDTQCRHPRAFREHVPDTELRAPRYCDLATLTQARSRIPPVPAYAPHRPSCPPRSRRYLFRLPRGGSVLCLRLPEMSRPLPLRSLQRKSSGSLRQRPTHRRRLRAETAVSLWDWCRPGDACRAAEP